MKIYLIIFILLLAAPSLAQDPPGKPFVVVQAECYLELGRHEPGSMSTLQAWAFIGYVNAIKEGFFEDCKADHLKVARKLVAAWQEPELQELEDWQLVAAAIACFCTPKRADTSD